MHRLRWGLTIGWLILIVSMFYDPVSAAWTMSDRLFAATTVNGCFQFQGECRPIDPYPMGARLFWGMVLPLVILTLLIFGHEAWRRICPLSFLSQIPRALGWQRKRTISETSWLGRNALSLQWSLLFIGLNLRLLLVNSDRHWLGLFLLLTIGAALTIGFLYDGKTWCNYFCPMAPVQKIYSEPSGLFGSIAHTAPPKTITQSMCRTVDKSGSEKSACVACKTGCMDIDAEGDYWNDLRKIDRKLLYYGYVGLVIGFYLYFWLYSGNWNLLSAGVWNETNQLATLLNPGFFIAGRAIAIPKLIAAPFTLTITTGLTYAIGLWAERQAKQLNQRWGNPLSVDQVQSRLFAIASFMAFNLLFFLGVRSTLGYLPAIAQQSLTWVAVAASSLWLAKTWQRSAQRYNRERDANLLRRQLTKLNIDLTQALEGRSLDELNPDELYALAKVLPGFSQDYQLQVYRGVLRDAFEQHSITARMSVTVFRPLRQKLGLSDELHWSALDQLQTQEPQLFVVERSRQTEPTLRRESDRHQDVTVYRGNAASPSRKTIDHRSNADTTVVRPLKDETSHERDRTNNSSNSSNDL
ncbi:hypothetical protein [Oculatella sp. LEGE 06141]